MAGSISLDSVITLVKNKEADILQNVSNTDDRKIILSVASVARFSLGYWDDAMNDGNSPWNSMKNIKNSNDKIAEMSWSGAAKADAGGAVAGLVRSGVAALFGPIGWGAVASNTIGTGLGASAGYAIINW